MRGSFSLEFEKAQNPEILKIAFVTKAEAK